jgi:hypothetical protein
MRSLRCMVWDHEKCRGGRCSCFCHKPAPEPVLVPKPSSAATAPAIVPEARYERDGRIYRLATVLEAMNAMTASGDERLIPMAKYRLIDGQLCIDLGPAQESSRAV